MEDHTWRERDEEGGKVYFKASHHASRWTLYRTTDDEPDWSQIPFQRDHWVTLRDVLWRKYQRKRCPWKMIEKIDKMLADWPEDQQDPPEPGN